LIVPNLPRKRIVEIFKLLVGAAILFYIGRQFYVDLRSDLIRQVSIKPLWLVGSAAVYLVAVGCSGLFWIRLMHSLDQPIGLMAGMRAYYISHLGKYLPGKAWAVWLRGEGAKRAGCSMSVAVATAFYEVLTLMATGALVAAVVFIVQPPRFHGIDFPPWVTGLILVVVCGLPLVPGVMSFVTRRLARRFAAIEHAHVRLSTLAQGVAIEMVGWALMGLSVWMCLCGTLDPAPELTLSSWADFSAVIGLAYALGFAAFMLPAGVGVREYVLREFLIPFVQVDDAETARVILTASALLLRCAWTLSELAMAGILAAVVSPTRKRGSGDVS
jgi:glycosyltransferase 2 family protein